MNKFLFSVLTLSLSNLLTAQILEIPAESPHAQVNQSISFTDVDIEYSRPNMKGRKIFGEQVPWGTVWRTGANSSTKINFSRDVLVNGKNVPKGKYSLYTIPDSTSWTIILNNDTTLWGHYGYNIENDFMRFDVPTQIGEYHETFIIYFDQVHPKQASIIMQWGSYKFSFKVEVDIDDLSNYMETEIRKYLSKPDDYDKPIQVAHNYLHAAMYYFDNGKDLDQALDWINKGLSLSEVNYFYLYKSDILGSLGRYKEAIEASKRGLQMFMKTGKNKEWIWRYETQIKKWEDQVN